MPALTKDHAGINLTCRASNNNLTAPIVKSVSLNVYLHPTSVEVSSLTHEAFEEDNEARLECETEGSIPAANISWTKTVAGVTENLPASVQQLGGKSVSRLRISPKYTDHGAKIVCRAHNPYLSGPGMTSTVSLNVKFAPRVSLHLGTSLAGRPINEAEDVYFECEVQCNPSPRSIMWRRD
ncbi:CD80-like immunoglobulin C2-set, partial [Trinorchestia longiramus]